MNGIKIKINPQSVSLSAKPESAGIKTGTPVARDVIEPYIKIEETDYGAVITCTDPDGTTTGTIYNGLPGQDGITPEISTTATTLEAGESAYAQTSGTAEQPLITFGIPRGADGNPGSPGKDGEDGDDGISPTISVTDIEGGHTVSITDANGTKTFNVMDGSPGQDGAAGVGIATGGVAGNVLKKKSATDYDTEWSNEWMFIAAYGKTTYADVLAAYQSNRIIYCRASSNNNPATGNQLRMAFLAYVNSEETPTEFEFQYYRSVATHSDSQQGDQVFVYKLKQSSGWEVTTRNAFTKIAAGTGLSSSYSSGVLTISLS